MANMQRKILVPIDGSKASMKALQVGGRFAELHGSEVIVLHVTEPVSGIKEFFGEEDYTEKRRSWGKRLLSKVTEGYTGPDVRISQMIVKGKPHKKIIEITDSMDVEMIVIGAHGTDTEGSDELGSNASKVFRNAKVPVITVPPNTINTEFKKVLLPIDPEFGAIELERYLYAWQNKHNPDVELLVILKGNEDVEEGHKYVNGQRKALVKAGLTNVTTKVIIGEDPAHAIVKYAEDNDHDIIWMETHGRSGLAEWVFGSVTANVLHNTHLPVLSLYPDREPIVRYYGHPNLPI